ncbi:MAG: MBL fold metallo-hydrolase [Kiloniellaceae bacterium]
MNPTYDIIVQGNNLRLRDGFLGLANLTLVDTADGPLLFDTGGYVSRLPLLKGLERRGLRPADVRIVFLSHLHFDHCHNIDLFAHAKVLVGKREWDYAAAPHEDDIFMPWGIHEQLDKHDLELIEGEGTLSNRIGFFPAPGHTPGGYALRLETDDKGTVVIAGDAIKYAREAINGRCDMAFDSVENGTETIARILDMADRIVPGHFPELIKTDRGFTWEDGVEFPLVVR